MIRCRRCGKGFSPVGAAVLVFCPRCHARDGAKVPLVTRVVKDGPIDDAGEDHGEIPGA